MRVGMAPRSKGPRVQISARVKKDVRDEMTRLAEVHDRSVQDELSEAIAAHISKHDPAMCLQPWCVAKREKKRR